MRESSSRNATPVAPDTVACDCRSGGGLLTLVYKSCRRRGSSPSDGPRGRHCRSGGEGSHMLSSLDTGEAEGVGEGGGDVDACIACIRPELDSEAFAASEE